MKKTTLNTFSRRYQSALLAHLKAGPSAPLHSAQRLATERSGAHLKILDLARCHEQFLITRVLPACPARKRAGLIRQASAFFGVAAGPAEGTDAAVQRNKPIEALSNRSVELAAANGKLLREIEQRKKAEATLKKRELEFAEMLKRADQMQKQMRRLSRQILSAHEDERKRISRELHDVVAQTLTGINFRLAILKKEAALNTRSLHRNIARTQALVEDSVRTIHQFARELRPALLDDLGLVPALHSFLKGFTERTGIHARLTAFVGIENLDIGHRTVLFRVAQEALTNVGRHSGATRVQVTIQRGPASICMKIQDDGKSFSPLQARRHSGGERLGLLGMKERVELIGGAFSVESARGEGATITATISLRKAAEGS